MEIIQRHNDAEIDNAELILSELPQKECPVFHHFTKGLYAREFHMEAGYACTSKIHNTQHPYILSKGAVWVGLDFGEMERFEAPYFGITQIGTRRCLIAETDIIWTTFHPIDSITGEEEYFSEKEKQKVVDEIEEMIIEKHDNLLINKKQKEEAWLGCQSEVQ